VCNSIGAIYYKMEKYDKALVHYNMVAFEHNFTDNALSELFNNKALCYSQTEQYDSAVFYLHKSIVLKEKHKDIAGLAISYLNLGDVYFQKQKDKTALSYFLKSRDLANAQNEERTLENAYYNLSMTYESLGNYKSALNNFKKSDSIRIKLDTKESIWKLSQIEKKLAVQSKQLQISELETLNTKKELELSTRSTQRNAFMAVSLGLLLIAGIVSIFLVQRNRASRTIARQRNELETLNKTKDRLFSIIAHDLRSPVNSLQQKNAQAMQSMESGDLPMAQEMIRLIRKDTEQASLLLNNLLHWSFSETGNLFLLPQPLLLRACIEQVVEELSFASREKQISFAPDIPPQLIVSTDLNSLRIILRNLLQNAVKFSYRHQRIEISCREEAAGVSIRIRDYGIGIPAELHHKLFGMDQEKIRKGTQNEQGSGLGLWLIHYLLQKNDGRISVNPDTAPGTEITVTLNHTYRT